MGLSSRKLFKSGLALAGASMVPALSKGSILSGTSSADVIPGKRKLGKSLEVSAIGLGVQNMSRTYQTTIPSRSELHNIIHFELLQQVVCC
jgi:hypothetical protein